MKNPYPLLCDIIVIIGITFFLSHVVARVFGWKEILLANTKLLIGYELALLFIASLGLYCYKRGIKSEQPEVQTGQETAKPVPGIDNQEATIAELREKMRKKAIVLRSSPVNELPEGYASCIGRVTWQLPGEEWPVDEEGNRLEPLATLFVPDLPGVPQALRHLALITIFAPEEGWAEDPEEKPRLGCVIRAYPTLEGLVPCDYVAASMKTCLLTPEAVANDMPKWPDCGGDEGLWNKILAMEEKYKIDYHKNICSAVYETHIKEDFPDHFSTEPGCCAVYETHKIGGYPTYAQGNPEFLDDYPFVMQINFDFDAELEIGDCGSYYFYYNAEKNDWRVYSDCY